MTQPKGPPLAHLLVPQPPWRPASWPGITACARLADQVGEALGLAAFRARVADDDAHLECTYCGSCYWSSISPAAVRSFGESPVDVVALDCGLRKNRTGRREQLAAELRALAALAAAHPEEFTELLGGEMILAVLAGVA